MPDTPERAIVLQREARLGNPPVFARLRYGGAGGIVASDKSDSQLEPELAEIGRRCERAVVTAYRELRRAGTDDLAAFQSCTTLYRIHHPEARLSEARALVAEWIDHHVVRESGSATRGCVG